MEESTLSWFDRVITPRTQAYKNFVNEMENTPSEQWFQDGEREFSDKEKKYMQIYESKLPKIELKYEIITNRENTHDILGLEKLREVVDFFTKVDFQKGESFEFRDFSNNTQRTISSETNKHSFLADLWAKELGKKTDLSLGMNNTQIDEQQASHYRKFQFSLKNDLNKLQEPSIGDGLAKEHNADINPLYSKEPNNDFLETYFDDIDSGLLKSENKQYLSNDEIMSLIPEERKGENFHIKVSKLEAEALINTEIISDVMNKEYGSGLGENHDAWTGMTKDDFDEESVFAKFDDEYQTFEIDVNPTTKTNLESLLFEISKLEKELKNAPHLFKNSEHNADINPLYSKVSNMDGNLPNGWKWDSYDDGSGHLESPSGKNYYSYDLQTQEYKCPFSNNEWKFMKDYPFSSQSLKEFKSFAEKDLLDSIMAYNIFPPLPEMEKQNLINYKKTEVTEVIGGKIKDIAAETIRNPDYLKQYDQNTQNVINLYINQNPNIMEKLEQIDYVKTNLKYLGFGESEQLHKDVANGIDSPEKQFEVKTTSDKTLPENTVEFTLKFNKSEQGGVFLNSYEASLINAKGENLTQNFPVSKDQSFTAKEAVNLMEGRSVKNEFVNPKTNEKESAFVKLNFNDGKNQYGNYNFDTYYKNYGIDVAQIVEKSNLIFDKPEYKDSTIASLEKGNIVKVKFEHENNVVEGKAVLNAQYKNLNLYDNEMNRINTNKPLQGIDGEQKNEKANVREQSISRGI